MGLLRNTSERINIRKSLTRKASTVWRPSSLVSSSITVPDQLLWNTFSRLSLQDRDQTSQGDNSAHAKTHLPIQRSPTTTGQEEGATPTSPREPQNKRPLLRFQPPRQSKTRYERMYQHHGLPLPDTPLKSPVIRPLHKPESSIPHARPKGG